MTAFLSERGDCGVSVITEEAREEGGERRTDRERNKDREQEDRNSWQGRHTARWVLARVVYK